MMGSMKRLRFALVGALVMLAQPAMLLADETPSYDARLEGYAGDYNLTVSSGAAWGMFVVLALLCFGVLFIRAPRSKE